ncbi:MAG TPA: type II CAAX endopeptidase family protein [Pyrinomonadaceae bacterium]|nr:type II CAAX endopeptidase family protein [Pyrinomonadaceae bacterium]
MKLSDIFVNDAGRLRSGWRFAVFIALYLLLFILVSFILFGLNRVISDVYVSAIIFAAISFLIAAIAGWVCNRLLEELPWRALGWTFNNRWKRDILSGVLIGSLSLLLAACIALLGGKLRFVLNFTGLYQPIIKTLFSSLAVFIPSAAAEEMLFRGYPLQTFARAHLAWVGLFLTSVPFALVHLGNPNVVLIFTFINTALAGVWLAVAYLKTRSLWLPLAIHFSWNWTMNAIMGIPVSGITEFAPAPLFRAIDSGPAWLTGGDYGLEGGAACTLALLVSTIFIWRARFLKPSEEMLRLTSNENPKRRDSVSFYDRHDVD